MIQSFETVKKIIGQHQRFLLTTHVNPDGDAVGSEIAFALFLRKLGKIATIMNHSRTPDNYLWLDPGKEIVVFDPERDGDLFGMHDAIVIIDTNHPERLRSLGPFVLQSNVVKILIDHHLEAHGFADHYVVDDDATSAGEIMYSMFSAIDPSLIDGPIATALYTAIVTDTGSFRFPRTDPETHQIVGALIAKGADPTSVYINVYENWSLNRMRLLGEMLDSMQTTYDGKLAYAVCTQEMFRKTNTTIEDTDNFTDYPMSVGGVTVTILFNELTDGVKISFRSKGTIPINELAKEFGGNGHLNAAGARVYNVKLQDLIPSVISKAGAFVKTTENM